MGGRNAFYRMGWDDTGFPTERRVQNYFHVRCEPGAPPFDVSKLEQADETVRKLPPRKLQRSAFIDLCVKLTAEDAKAFKALWQRLGLSVDWSQEYSTISEHSRRIAQLSFLDLCEKKHVYTLEAPTLWDVEFKTRVAQAEVEDRPMKGPAPKLRFPGQGGRGGDPVGEGGSRSRRHRRDSGDAEHGSGRRLGRRSGCSRRACARGRARANGIHGRDQQGAARRRAVRDG